MGNAREQHDGMGRPIEIRHCSAHAEFDRCIELQRQVWGYKDYELVPREMFVIAANAGGQVIGAFLESQMVGFIFALPAFRGSLRYLHSHMAAVAPQLQNLGIGRALKLKQREEALARGLALVEWTFDPLEARNAHFNIMRLGAVVRRCVPDFYGTTSSPLHAGLPTDRLIAEWWLNSQRVDTAITGQRHSGLRGPRVELPAAIEHIKRSDLKAARRLQEDLRLQLEDWFRQGFAITGFESNGTTCAYVLEFLSPNSDGPAGPCRALRSGESR